MSEAAMAPSPTADATRLMEPCRRSPATNTPGWLDSKGIGIPAELPPGPGWGVCDDILAGQEKSVLVAPDPPFEADRDRPGPDEQEHRICGELVCLVVPLAPEDDAPQVGVTASFGDLRRRSNRDPWMLVDPFDEVVRHSSGEACSADDDCHRLRVFGHVKRRLAGGVAAADDHHVAALQPNCFSRRGAVVDSCANELLELLGPQVAGSPRRWRRHRSGLRSQNRRSVLF